MPNIDPKVAFWFGLAVFLTSAIAQGGTALLSDAIPAMAIPIVVKWSGIITTLGTGVLTYIARQNMTPEGRIASAETLPLQTRATALADNSNGEVKAVVLSSQAAADANTSPKVIGPLDVDIIKKAA